MPGTAPHVGLRGARPQEGDRLALCPGARECGRWGTARSRRTQAAKAAQAAHAHWCAQMILASGHPSPFQSLLFELLRCAKMSRAWQLGSSERCKSRPTMRRCSSHLSGAWSSGSGPCPLLACAHHRPWSRNCMPGGAGREVGKLSAAQTVAEVTLLSQLCWLSVFAVDVGESRRFA